MRFTPKLNISVHFLSTVPGAPRFAKGFVISSRSIYINWTTPAVTNGKLVKYVVYYDKTEAYSDNTTLPMNQTLPPNITWLVIKDLVPFTKYTLQVQAFTEVGGGNLSHAIGPMLTFEDGKFPLCKLAQTGPQSPWITFCKLIESIV